MELTGGDDTWLYRLRYADLDEQPRAFKVFSLPSNPKKVCNEH